MVDAVDRKILSKLQENGRLTHGQLADHLGLSVCACHRRVKQLEERGVITGYSAIVDRTKLDLKVLAYIFIKLDAHTQTTLSEFEKRIAQMKEVVACHAVSGGGDYILKVIAEDMDAFADIALKQLARLPGLKDSSSNFVLSTLKESPGWPAEI